MQASTSNGGSRSDQGHLRRGSDVKIHGAMHEPGGKLGRYMDLVLGRRSLWKLFVFETIVLLVGRLPGALGIALRGWLYPIFLGSVGRGVVFGAGITFRHPLKIHIGDLCVIDDGCMLDAKGTTNSGIVLEEGVFLGRNTILSCKNGDIVLRARANLGFFCDVFSSNRVEVGADTVIAAYTYILSGGSYLLDRLDLPIAQQYDLAASKPTTIGPDSWLGARVTVVEGTRVGRGCVLGAGSVVIDDIPDYAIAVGVPAKVTRMRAPAANAGEP
jgi:acetyltransferase-like isoleucine patch superfamily enzyme